MESIENEKKGLEKLSFNLWSLITPYLKKHEMICLSLTTKTLRLNLSSLTVLNSYQMLKKTLNRFHQNEKEIKFSETILKSECRSLKIIPATSESKIPSNICEHLSNSTSLKHLQIGNVQEDVFTELITSIKENDSIQSLVISNCFDFIKSGFFSLMNCNQNLKFLKVVNWDEQSMIKMLA
jgi:hypothetical protein